jgi:hypothetical protein
MLLPNPRKKKRVAGGTTKRQKNGRQMRAFSSSSASVGKVFANTDLTGANILKYLCNEIDLAVLRLVSTKMSEFATLDMLWERILYKNFGALRWEMLGVPTAAASGSSNRAHSCFRLWLEWTTICHSAVVVLITPSHRYNINKANGVRVGGTLRGTGTPPVVSRENVHYYDESIIFGTSGFWCERRTTDLTFGLGDFTVECWIRLLEEWKNNDIMLCNYGFFNANGGIGMDLYVCSAWHTGPTHEDEEWNYATNDCEAFNVISDGNDSKLEQYNSICDNKFHHIAHCRRDGVLYLYHDGICVAHADFNHDINPKTDLFIGSRNNTNLYNPREISEFRVLRGVARYFGGDFIPPQRKMRHGDLF